MARKIVFGIWIFFACWAVGCLIPIARHGMIEATYWLPIGWIGVAGMLGCTVALKALRRT